MDERPTFGSLFAGIGGIDLGLERAGWTGRWQVEWDEYCQHVLAHHWPDISRYGDITTVDWSTVEPVDLIAGGFPCQPISIAGRGKGTDDDRWLWPEFARAVGALRPSVVLVENVPGLLAGGGMGRVLGDLAELGFDAQWDSIPAAAVGAPHLRYRVWIVAYRSELGRAVADADLWRPFDAVRSGRDASRDASRDGGTDGMADADRLGLEGERRTGLLVTGPPLGHDSDRRGCKVADAAGIRPSRSGGGTGAQRSNDGSPRASKSTSRWP